MTTTTTSRGYAFLNPITQQFLDACPAVSSWAEPADGLAAFDFDPAVEVMHFPDGVYFDLDAAPQTLRDAVENLWPTAD